MAILLSEIEPSITVVNRIEAMKITDRSVPGRYQSRSCLELAPVVASKEAESHGAADWRTV